jgi:hypothetical protein
MPHLDVTNRPPSRRDLGAASADAPAAACWLALLIIQGRRAIRRGFLPMAAVWCFSVGVHAQGRGGANPTIPVPSPAAQAADGHADVGPTLGEMLRLDAQEALRRQRAALTPAAPSPAWPGLARPGDLPAARDLPLPPGFPQGFPNGFPPGLGVPRPAHSPLDLPAATSRDLGRSDGRSDLEIDSDQPQLLSVIGLRAHDFDGRRVEIALGDAVHVLTVGQGLPNGLRLIAIAGSCATLAPGEGPNRTARRPEVSTSGRTLGHPSERPARRAPGVVANGAVQASARIPGPASARSAGAAAAPVIPHGTPVVPLEVCLPSAYPPGTGSAEIDRAVLPDSAAGQGRTSWPAAASSMHSAPGIRRGSGDSGPHGRPIRSQAVGASRNSEADDVSQQAHRRQGVRL